MGYLDDQVARIDGGRKKRGSRIPTIVVVAVLLLAAAVGGAVLFAYTQQRSIVVIPLEGEIHTGDFAVSGFVGSEYVGRQLREAADDPLVEGIVLRVNSPGGSPAAAQEIVADMEYARSRKPVVVSMGEVATSAAYYVSAHGDRIYASPDTLTGSIGTTWTFYNISGWLEREGIAVEVVKSGSRKDMTSPYRGLSDEESAYAQALVNESYERFIADILEQRNVSRDLIGDGRVIRGEEALRIGLVDQFGNLYDAIAGARSLAGVRPSSAGPTS
ncbi:MAG: signal peptide peptidase SppA [Methanomicrobiales archaeon]|nr:signal peptide peptidase SppA [Methanomicrobiales archaeon]MDI6877282.1 signal peptide peptidase SppA [Methanomicrobiales archaeon]